MELGQYLQRFDEKIRAPGDVPAALDLFTALATDRATLQGEVRRLLQGLVHDPLFLPAGVMDAQIILSPLPRPEAHYDLALGRYSATAPSIVSHCVYGLVTPLFGTMRVEHYRLPAALDRAVFSDEFQLERCDDFEVRPGEALAIGPGRDAYRVRAARPVVALKLASRPVVPFEWSFDELTLRSWQSISAIPTETNLVHACRAAAALGEQALVEPLGGVVRHERHMLRWEALRSLCLIDRTAGLAAVEDLCDDAHPHVRRAAQRARGAAMQEAA
jgi:hypothetical protein